MCLGQKCSPEEIYLKCFSKMSHSASEQRKPFSKNLVEISFSCEFGLREIALSSFALEAPLLKLCKLNFNYYDVGSGRFQYSTVEFICSQNKNLVLSQMQRLSSVCFITSTTTGIILPFWRSYSVYSIASKQFCLCLPLNELKHVKTFHFLVAWRSDEGREKTRCKDI